LYLCLHLFMCHKFATKCMFTETVVSTISNILFMLIAYFSRHCFDVGQYIWSERSP
jgi:hypothetical protein